MPRREHPPASRLVAPDDGDDDGGGISPLPLIAAMTRDLTTDDERRYARQLGPGVLSSTGQARLKQATVLITRVGGMGGPAALALAMAGVGRIIIAHGGSLELPDLNRQVLGCEAGLGQPRAAQFAERLRAMNRHVVVEAIDHEPDDDEAIALAQRCDVLISSPPNFAERLRLNRAAVATGKPLIDAAQWGITGTLIGVRPGETACLECLYPTEPPFEEFFPVVGAISSAIGSLAALETIKLIAGFGQSICGRMLVYDGAEVRANVVELRPRADCRCGAAGKSAEDRR